MIDHCVKPIGWDDDEEIPFVHLIAKFVVDRVLFEIGFEVSWIVEIGDYFLERLARACFNFGTHIDVLPL